MKIQRDSFKILLAAVFTCILSSCEKGYVAEEEEGGISQCGTLAVRAVMEAAGTAQSDDLEKAEVSYPVNIYVFDSNGTCAATSALEAEDDDISISLQEGKYRVYAVAGAKAKDYELPSKSEAEPESVIKLRDGSSHGDLMTAYNSVTMEEGERNLLDMRLERKVMNVRSITVENIPQSVKGVSVTLSPLYSDLRLDGSFKYDDDTQAIKLTEDDSKDGTWRSSETIYMFPASGNATVKVTMTQADGTKESFSYTCDNKLEANYRVDIKGAYKSGNFTLTGTLTGDVWAGTRTIEFTGGTDDSGQQAEGDAPEAGTLYKGCYVLTSERQGNSGKTRVVLMSPRYNDEWSFKKGNVEALQSEVNSKINKLAVKGITGWRLPTLDEVKYGFENHTAINEKIEKIRKTTYIADFSIISTNYLFKDGDEIKLYKHNKGDPTILKSKSIGAGTTTTLRAFATLIFND